MLIILGLILISLIVIVGGDRGVVSLIALVGNLLLLSFAIWLMATGVPVLFVTVGAGIVISCITLFYQNGTNVKTWSAFISVAITMLVLFFAIYVVIWSTEAGGLNEIQSVGDDILYYNMDLNISMRNVMVSVILLSTLGAILDMALTVATSVYEVKNHKSEMKFTELVESENRKRSDRNNGKYIAVCISWRITIVIYLFENAKLFVGTFAKFKNIVSKFCFYDFRCNCLCNGDADCGSANGKNACCKIEIQLY